MSRRTTLLVPLLATLVCVSLAWWAWPSRDAGPARPQLPLVQGTSREDLADAEQIARARLAADETDAPAAVRLAEVLLRRARVESDASHAIEAERVLETALKAEPGEYSALKVLGAVYLSQHRFAESVEVATRAIAVNDRDAWNYGVLGDGHLELGHYERAFDAFDMMARLRPDAASYARTAYAHELQGRLGEALRHMRMAAEATGTHDPESLAWHYAQVGNILFRMGRVDAASHEFARARHAFPGHPYARTGLARVAAARGDYPGALESYRALLGEAPTPELAATVGDLLGRTGDAAGAEAMYVQAETLEREGWQLEEPQPAALARMLAERGRDVEEAVTLAEEAARSRSDIFTMDALAWAYYQAGRFPEAHAASVQARRTGTADPRIRCHGAAIDEAVGDDGAARNSERRAQCGFEQWITGPEAEVGLLG